MPLTMTPERFEEIRRLVREQHLAKEAAKIVAETDRSRQPGFTDVDQFLAHLDRLAASNDRSPRSPRQKKP